MEKRLTRGAGILLAISSLPSPYGIGTLGRAAFAFVDFLKNSGQTYWQVLPVGPTGFGDSPYQSFSAFAGNPYFIDLDLLAADGLLTTAELDAVTVADPARVDYAWLYRTRFPLLRKAFARWSKTADSAYNAFCRVHENWLTDYALFMALKTYFHGCDWLGWDKDIRMRQPDAVMRYTAQLASEISFWKFCQYQFFRQWVALREYANRQGIQIIGDIPIYIAPDSADVWAHRDLFQLEEDGHPTCVAGVPPDAFSPDGQRWGNPLYDWERMAADGFAWWRQRATACAALYDVLRIDHFIGIARYYAIPASCDTAKEGEWRTGPGKALTNVLDDAVGSTRILAEDLGILHPTVRELLADCGYPGMRILEFAFDGNPKNDYLPHRYMCNTVVYGGTHDNEPLAGYCAHCSPKERRYMRRYLRAMRDEAIPAAMVYAAYGSVADTVIFQMQDLLALGSTARMNKPSTIGGNWQWRVLPEQLSPRLAKRLRWLTRLYNR